MNQKTVLVTGASRGIGKAIALRFAKEGYHLIITCRKNKTLLEEVKKEIEAYGVRCLSFVGDMGDYNTISSLYQEIKKQFATLDVIVNNAGISIVSLITDVTPADWMQIINTNLSSAFYCSQQGIPLMLQKKQGKIINISSVWGNVGASMEVAYSTTKGGINAMTKALAKELAPSNIQVNAIACGAIDTEMNQFLSEEDRQCLIDEIPCDRFGTPEEVADLAWQLASSSSYLTGQIITLDGGWI